MAIGRLAFEFREMHLRVARMPDHGVAFLGPESDASCHTQLIVYDPGSEAPRESESATRDRTETSSALRGRGPGSGRVHHHAACTTDPSTPIGIARSIAYPVPL